MHIRCAFRSHQVNLLFCYQLRLNGIPFTLGSKKNVDDEQSGKKSVEKMGKKQREKSTQWNGSARQVAKKAASKKKNYDQQQQQKLKNKPQRPEVFDDMAWATWCSIQRSSDKTGDSLCCELSLFRTYFYVNKISLKSHDEFETVSQKRIETVGPNSEQNVPYKSIPRI